MRTSIDHPPAVPNHGVYWERQSDPFHVSAILPALQQQGLSPTNLAILDHGPIRDGWMLIDWAENPIGWVPDGLDVPEHNMRFDFKEGPCKRLCAYPVPEGK